MNKLAQLISTLGPVGFLPASGTIATAIFFVVSYLLQIQHPFVGWGVVLILLLLWFCTYTYSRMISERDPKQIVSDEIVASLLLVWLIPHSLLYYVLAFVFFRFFDIFKPLGIKSVEKLPCVYGIISDDLLAAFYTLLIIRLIQFVS